MSQSLFDLMHQEHGLTLTETELADITYSVFMDKDIDYIHYANTGEIRKDYKKIIKRMKQLSKQVNI